MLCELIRSSTHNIHFHGYDRKILVLFSCALPEAIFKCVLSFVVQCIFNNNNIYLNDLLFAIQAINYQKYPEYSDR